MKVEDFLSKQPPEQMTVAECIAEAEKDALSRDETLHLDNCDLPGGHEGDCKEEPEHVTSLTPSGIEVYYSWAPRRHYKVRVYPRDYNDSSGDEWREVPSVTTILNVLDKSGAIGWWSFRVGLKAIVELYRQKVLPAFPNEYPWEQLEKLIVEHKLSPNHVKDEAAGRGVNIHDAFEKWAGDTSYRPNRDFYPESEQGYVDGLNAFLDDLSEVSDIEAEVMVGSVEHGFAGRYDLRLTIPTPREMVVKTYPKRKPKVAEVPAGKWLLDLKTSKRVYDTHALQLAAYELASVECGYGATDQRAVVHVTAEGTYELVVCHAKPEDFQKATQRVYRAGDRSTAIVLPVMP